MIQVRRSLIIATAPLLAMALLVAGCETKQGQGTVAGAVVGGMTSLPGAVFGAYIIGIVEHLFGGYVSIEFKSVVAFAIIVLVLCIKPSGLFARHYVKKV